MKKARKIFIIVFLFTIFIYCLKIDSIPNKIILYGGEELNFKNFFGITLNANNKKIDTVLASSEIGENGKEEIVDVKLFGLINVKEVSVNIIEKTSVIPVGQVSGLKLYTNGVLVVGMSEIKGDDNKKYKPYENSGIEEGDRITKVDGKEVTDTNRLTQIVNNSSGNEIEIEYVRENEFYKTKIKPIKYFDGTYKLGLWVRDSAAGIGTLTFYEPSTGNFAALGHGITDSDTGNLLEIQNGEFLTTKILSIIKGLKRKPRKNSRNIRRGRKYWSYL